MCHVPDLCRICDEKLNNFARFRAKVIQKNQEWSDSLIESQYAEDVPSPFFSSADMDASFFCEASFWERILKQGPA